MFRQYSEHSFSDRLQKISAILDLHPEIADWVHSNLGKSESSRGSHGMSAESVVRAALLKQVQDLTYDELEFQVADSQSARAFIRVPDGRTYSRSALQANIKAISLATWQRIQKITVDSAASTGFETGKTIRIDATVVETNTAYPLDSKLIVDCIRVGSRAVRRMNEVGVSAKLRLTLKRAKKLQLAILNARGAEAKKPHYHDLVVAAGDVLKQLPELLKDCRRLRGSGVEIEKSIAELSHIQEYLGPILAQTIARVFDEQPVAASDKIVSIFETHADIIVKGGRETEFGHKVFFTTGKSNVVIDCEIETGNPHDSEKFLDALDRVKALYGRYPLQVTADGGFASQDNVHDAHELGVKDVCFNKKVDLEPEEMCRSKAIFKKLAKLRAGIESNISALKRAFGLTRANWKGIEGFKSYVWSAVCAYNFMLLAV
jgi:IS5 family transposase